MEDKARASNSETDCPEIRGIDLLGKVLRKVLKTVPRVLE
jgi:hypothetical protein